MNCPNCNTEIKKENINIHTDVGQCHHCNHIFKISENIGNEMCDGFDIHNPPAGAWIVDEPEHMLVGATTRHPIAFFIVPFMIVWSGGSIGGIYGSQLINGEFNPTMSVFGIPFLIGSIIFWSFALMTVWGKVELKLDKKGGTVFTGVGTVGLTKTFTWDEIKTIKENQSLYRYPGSQGTAIHMEGKRRISFGLGVNETRRYYLIRAIKIAQSRWK